MRINNYTFDLDSYFIFPNQMILEEEAYSREDFYKNLKALVRLRQPKLSFKKIMGEDETGEPTPVSYLMRYLARAKAADKSIDTLNFPISEVRLWTCSFYRFFFRQLRKLLEHTNEIQSDRLRETLEDEQWFEMVRSLLVEGEQIIDRMAEVRKYYENSGLSELAPIVDELGYAEEYCLYIFLDCLATVKHTFDLLKKSKITQRDAEKLLDAFIAEKRQMAVEKYKFYPDENSPTEILESYVVRRSFLKKRMQSVLYLDVRQKPLFYIQQQFGPMIAAGIAAAWWIFAELTLIKMSTSGRLSLQNISASGLIIISAFILAYVLKDRIKETGRVRFRSGIRGHIPDHNNEVYYHPDSTQMITVGRIKEYAHSKKKSQLSEDLLELLGEHTHLRIEESDRAVIHYRKKFVIQPKHLLRSKAARLRAIHDIVRFNFSSFLPMLDDPFYKRLAIDSDNEVTSLRLPKCYYVYMLNRYSIYEGKKDTKRKSHLDLVRLVLNKSGLVRVEILSKGQRGLIQKKSSSAT